MFSSVIRQFISGTPHLLSVASTHAHTQSSSDRLTFHCAQSLTVAARLLNDQCVFIKSYHRAVCSTDKGHVILFPFFECLSFGVERDENVLISNIPFGGFFLWKHIAFLLEKNILFCHTNKMFLPL